MWVERRDVARAQELRASALFVASSLPAAGAGYAFALSLDRDKIVSRVNGVERRVLLATR